MGVGAIDGAQSTARVEAGGSGRLADRNQDARIVVAGRALKRPDTETFLIDILSALGLDGKTDAPPSPVRLIQSDEIKGTGRRAADATTYGEPDEPRRGGRPKSPINHGAAGGYNAHLRRDDLPCDPCRDEHNRDQRERKAARRAAARATTDQKG